MKYPDYETIKVFWDWGCYDDKIMRDYVEWGYLTPEEYEKITGWKYDKSEPSTEEPVEHPTEDQAGVEE